MVVNCTAGVAGSSRSLHNGPHRDHRSRAVPPPFFRVMSLTVALAFVATSAVAPAAAGTLRFLAGELDTNTLPGLRAARAGAVAENARLVIIQFEGPIQAEWLSAVTKMGAQLRGYVPDFAYWALLDPEQLVAVQHSPGVKWVGRIPGRYKVDPNLRRHAQVSGLNELTVTVLSYDEGVEKALAAQGYSISRVHRRDALGWYSMKVRAPAATLDRLAEQDGVFCIDVVPQYELHGERGAQTAAGNYVPGAAAPSGPGYTAWLAAHGLTGGAGLIVHVQDDGLDRGNASNAPGTAHPDILGRIAGIFNATSDSSGDSRAGHGMLNAGILIGNAAAGNADSQGYKLGQGMAPLARVYATKIFRNSGSFDIGTNTFTGLTKRAQDAGALFSSNSWGAAVNGAYNEDSAEFDALVRDADPTEPGNQPMTFFFSAGNSGSGAGTLGAPATAKNVIAVGAGENSDADGTDGCNIGPSGANNIRDLIYFSSRGPTQDGRLGVTLVAVGTHVQGPASTVAGYDGSGVCDKYWPSGQTMYARSSGTSHSCPIACGAGMIVHEFFQTQLSSLGHTDHPSPALIKAVLTNTATDMVGGNNGAGGLLTAIPNTNQGWGSVNLSTLVTMKETLYSFDQGHRFTGSGQVWEIRLAVPDPGKPFKVTLAWTDAPGTPGANPVLANDLDLEVTGDEGTYRGNVFSGGASTLGGTADRRNNLEAVFVRSPASGMYTVRVVAYNISRDGVPNVGGSPDQDFALFAWNASEVGPSGTIDIERTAINCNDEFAVTVRDSDLRGQGEADISLVTLLGDALAVTVRETRPDSGVFTGTVRTQLGTPLVDGLLQVQPGEIVTATYEDASNAHGQPAVVYDTAAVDCTPPTISNVTVSNISARQARVSFSTNEPARGSAQFGVACDTLVQSVTGAPGQQSHVLDLAGLVPETTYAFRVRAVDPAQNEAVADNGGACFPFSTPVQPDYFTEQFSAADNDLRLVTLVFTPSGTPDRYRLCLEPANSFPTDSGSGTVLSLADDDYRQVTLSAGRRVVLYGVSYPSFFVGSNGYLTFLAGDTTYTESLTEHFRVPRVSALFDDLNPASGGSVRFAELADRAVVTFNGIKEYGASTTNSFQIQLFYDGRITITYLEINARDGLVGLSAGGGIPTDYVESDLSAYPSCQFTPTATPTFTATRTSTPTWTNTPTPTNSPTPIPPATVESLLIEGNPEMGNSTFEMGVRILPRDGDPIGMYAFLLTFNSNLVQIAGVRDGNNGFGMSPEVVVVPGGCAVLASNVDSTFRDGLLLVATFRTAVVLLQDYEIGIGDYGPTPLATVSFLLLPRVYRWENTVFSPGGWRCLCAHMALVGDLDADGIADTLEYEPLGAAQTAGTSRVLWDTDGDGLADGEEDTNHDGTWSSGELDPRDRDTDGDSLWDGVEVYILRSKPLDPQDPPQATVDIDRDGLPASEDPDDRKPDFDGDLFADGTEALLCGLLSVADNTRTPPLGDTNCDGFVSNIDALIVNAQAIGVSPYGTQPGETNSDVNRDGFLSNLDALVIQTWFVSRSVLLPAL